MSTTLAQRLSPSARFQRLCAEWKSASQFLSNTAQMSMLPSYQRIVGMGWDAVPLLLDELHRRPDHWFWALEAITDENPVRPEDSGSLDRMAAAWLEWGRNAGLVAK